MAVQNGFDKKAFYGYLNEAYEEMTVFDVLDKIIEYAHKWEHVSKDQFVRFVADMLPDSISFEDVAQFAEDGILTQTTLKQLGRVE